MYINYCKLQKYLELLEVSGFNDETGKLFKEEFESQIRCMLTLYTTELRKIKTRIIKLEQEFEAVQSSLHQQSKIVTSQLDQWRSVGQAVDDLIEFANLNLASIRKIIKHFVKKFGNDFQQECSPIAYCFLFDLPKDVQQGMASMKEGRDLEQAKVMIQIQLAKLHTQKLVASPSTSVDSLGASDVDKIHKAEDCNMDRRYSNTDFQSLNNIKGQEDLILSLFSTPHSFRQKSGSLSDSPSFSTDNEDASAVHMANYLQQQLRVSSKNLAALDKADNNKGRVKYVMDRVLDTVRNAFGRSGRNA